MENSLSALAPIAPNTPRSVHIEPPLPPQGLCLDCSQALVVTIVPFGNVFRCSDLARDAILCEEVSQGLLSSLAGTRKHSNNTSRVEELVRADKKIRSCFNLLDAVRCQSNIGDACLSTAFGPLRLPCLSWSVLESKLACS